MVYTGALRNPVACGTNKGDEKVRFDLTLTTMDKRVLGLGWNFAIRADEVSLSLFLSVSLSHTHTPSLSHTHTLFLSLSLSLTHPHTLSLSLSCSLSLSFSLSLYLYLSLSLSLSLSPPLSRCPNPLRSYKTLNPSRIVKSRPHCPRRSDHLRSNPLRSAEAMSWPSNARVCVCVCLSVHGCA